MKNCSQLSLALYLLVYLLFSTKGRVKINSFSVDEEIANGCICDSKRDSLALLDFYYASNINWDLKETISEWEGITLNTEGCVKSFIFRGNAGFSMKGEIPSSFFKNLLCLQQLEFYNNYDDEFNMEIPPEIENLTFLERLDLSANNIEGIIPPEIGSLTNLKYLNLRRNGMIGNIPESLGRLSNLQELYFHENELTGAIPKEFGELKELLILDLHDNHLDGPLPPELGKLKKLTKIDVRQNELIGNLPKEWGSIINLKTLRLNDNNLFGSIPASFQSLKKLAFVDLSNNQFSSSELKDLNQLRNLWSINLDNNKLVGNIPFTISNSQQEDLSISLRNNFLQGDFPLELDNPRISLRISGNNFQNLKIFQRINSLEISNNELTFEDIIPNLWATSTYSPQKEFFPDTTILFNQCETPTINLNIDKDIPDNIYKWYKNGDSIFITNNFKLNLREVLEDFSDYSGIYTCEVTNPSAPALTLTSGEIIVELDETLPIPDTIFVEREICLGTSTEIAGTNYDCSTPTALTPVPDSITGCHTIYSITLNCKPCQNVDTSKIPTAFSPNGDGINETFIIPFINLENNNNQLIIYNKNGQIVYQQSNYQNNWKGEGLQGNWLSLGTYYYVFESGTGKPLQGKVTIVR